MRLDKFTTKFQQALADAQSIAVGNDNPYIEPVHLLSALIAQEDGGTASLLARAGANLARLRGTIEKSRDQALRAGNTIRSLRELLNTGSGTAQPLDLNHEIRDALRLARTDLDLDFHTRLTLERGLSRVRANRIHLQKVLLNLFHNAVEAMRDAHVPQPEVIITVRTSRDGNVAQVTIRDNGPGIDPRDAGHLFETFFTTKAQGIGMGLAISRSLIEANGGQLWCDPGQAPGATFHLTLPFEK